MVAKPQKRPGTRAVFERLGEPPIDQSCRKEQRHEYGERRTRLLAMANE